MKRCSRCGFLKPPCEFSARADTPDGKQYLCKVCLERARQYHRATRPQGWVVHLKKKREAQG